MENEKDETLNKIFKNIKTKKKLSIGDVVYGRIQDVNNKLVVINIESKDNKVLSPSDRSILLVKDIDRGYTENIEDNYRKGDVIKAKIISADDFGFKLTTAEPELGVMLAYCTNCKTKLEVYSFKDKQMKCPKCGKIETRKIAKGVKNEY